jgi:NADH-quinone oxidoreductase subunit L
MAAGVTMAVLPWLILWIPFLSAGTIMFFLLERPRSAGRLATLSMFLCFSLTLALLVEFYDWKAAGRIPWESSLRWISLENMAIEFGILVNGLTLLMLLVVTGVGSFIFLYSNAYMEKDESYSRYFACLSLFAFSMIGIVLSNNFIQIFIFWELVGLSSYLLIGFWLEKPEAATAGKKAFLTTRVGDVGMMIGILLLFGFLIQQKLGTFNFLAIQQNLREVRIPPSGMALATFFIFLGVVGKSAQVPLHVWLPDAMEGPTPVSALIHAATMVAAGVFLLARLLFLFMYSSETLQVIAWTGAITAFLAATMAIVENDIKRILAYSTLSQLGYMVMALGLRSSEAGMFHLTTHAFFKALLFLGAGSLIHALHAQDIWEMRSPAAKQGFMPTLFKKMPITSFTFFIGTLALMGIPPLSGYFSKEELLAVAYNASLPLFWIAVTTVFLTAFYMGRLLTVVFFRQKLFEEIRPSVTHAQDTSIHEPDWRILIPLVVLAFFSAFGGYLPIRELLPDRTVFETPHALEQMSIILALGGFASAFLIYCFVPRSALQTPLIRLPEYILQRKYFFDDLYDFLIRVVQENLARLSDAFERWIIVETGVNGTARLTQICGDFLRKLQTGMVQFYALLFTGGVTAVIFAFILWGKS